MYTKELVQEKLSSDVRWMERGVIVLLNRQTEEEKKSMSTLLENGRGFNGTDVRYLTWVGNYLMSGRHLSGHHVEKVGKKLPKYWKQIMEEIELRSGS